LPLYLRRQDLYEKFAVKHKLHFEFVENNCVQQTKISQISFFKEKFDQYEKRVVNSTFYKALDLITFIDWLEKKLSPGDLVLDLGCGTGRQSISFAKHDIKTIGLDISEEMLMQAKRKIDNLRLGKYIDLIVGDAENPPFKNNSFKACVIYGTLHHFPNKSTVIQNAAKKLKNNGLFYSVDPNNTPIRFIFDFLMKICKLYDDEASDQPLVSKKELSQWLFNARIKNTIKYSTFLPPHLLYLFNVGINVNLLKLSDSIFNKIPGVRDLAGVIIAEGERID